jgi:hypothetical protein
MIILPDLSPMTKNLVKNQLSWTCRSYDLYIRLQVAVKTNASFMKYFPAEVDFLDMYVAWSDFLENSIFREETFILAETFRLMYRP